MRFREQEVETLKSHPSFMPFMRDAALLTKDGIHTFFEARRDAAVNTVDGERPLSALIKY